MILLAIDTTGPNCSVALRVPGRADVCETDVIGRGHAEHLAPMVARLLDQSGLSPKDVDRLAVTVGPGSFAGTRVGIAFIRGLAIATGAETVGLNNLDILASQILEAGPVIALHDAKRGEVIISVKQDGATRDPERLDVAQISSRLEDLGRGILAGSGAKLVDLDGFCDSGICELDLSVFLDMAQAANPETDLATPFYARPPDAKLPGGVTP